MAETILSEDKLMRWLNINPWRVKELLLAGMPSLHITRELRFYSKQKVTEWLLKMGTGSASDWAVTQRQPRGDS